jgi:hypothetical protein
MWHEGLIFFYHISQFIRAYRLEDIFSDFVDICIFHLRKRPGHSKPFLVRFTFFTATCPCVPCDSTWLPRNLWCHQNSQHISTSWWMGGQHGQAREVMWREEQYGNLEVNRKDTNNFSCVSINILHGLDYLPSTRLISTLNAIFVLVT